MNGRYGNNRFQDGSSYRDRNSGRFRGRNTNRPFNNNIKNNNFGSGQQGNSNYNGGFNGKNLNNNDNGFGNEYGTLTMTKEKGNLDDVKLEKPDFSSLTKFEKNFYKEHEDVKNRAKAVVNKYRKDKQIHVVGKGMPKPVTKFEEACFPGNLIISSNM